jgi:8-oxo-dGTP diphosphatase
MAARKDFPEFERPLTLVDVVIFAVIAERLQVLLVERAEAPFAGALALPGGFVDVSRDASLEACALRKLKEKTGVESPYLEQLGSWGGRDRDPRGWSTTHVYFALVPANAGEQLAAGANAADVSWHPVVKDGVGEKLGFDHAEILETAVRRLRGKVEYTSLPAFLLPREFTLTELQRAYEIVLGRTLEKSAFRTRMLATNLVVETGKTRTAASRPAMVYRLRSATKPVVFPRTFGPN